MRPTDDVRRRPPRALFALLALFGPLIAHAPALQAQESEVARLLRGRIEVLRATGEAWAGGERLLAHQALPRFYDARGFEPAWVSLGGAERLEELERATWQSGAHGLDPADYHLETVARLRQQVSDRASVDQLVELELLASDAFMLLGSHLLHGRVDPERIDPEWIANRRGALLDQVLADALTENRVREALLELAPQQPRYRRMVEAAERLRAIAGEGGWPQVPAGPSLEIGVEGQRVSALRGRLAAPRDLGGGASEDGPFDVALAEAVRSFQARHGLDVDGVVGPATLAALNVPVETRLRQLEINLERWRWLPADLGERHIEVNIAGFDVKVVDSGRTVRTHRAVVGRQYRQTPMFSGLMTYLVLSPYWHVPPTIAAVDKLPQIKSDPTTIASQRMQLLSQRTNEAVDVASVDWAAITGAEFNANYRLRQDPGPFNALGAVKFMFPNRYNVYLHDTPTRELFDRTARDFSSGCIRIENPLALAEYLLSDQPRWTRTAIEAAASAGTEQTVRLREALPVHLLYWTAWADEGGVIHFRPDIYGRDTRVWTALQASPPIA